MRYMWDISFESILSRRETSSLIVSFPGVFICIRKYLRNIRNLKTNRRICCVTEE